VKPLLSRAESGCKLASAADAVDSSPARGESLASLLAANHHHYHHHHLLTQFARKCTGKNLVTVICHVNYIIQHKLRNK